MYQGGRVTIKDPARYQLLLKVANVWMPVCFGLFVAAYFVVGIILYHSDREVGEL